MSHEQCSEDKNQFRSFVLHLKKNTSVMETEGYCEISYSIRKTTLLHNEKCLVAENFENIQEKSG